jgi:hypothetical protein
MSLLLAPLFAQVVTLGVADRSEVRYLTPYNYEYEAETVPGVRLTLRLPRYEAMLGYDASLIVAPLEREPRDLLVYHTLLFDTSYRFRRSSISFSSTGSFGEVNFRAQALGAAATPEPGTTEGAPGDQGTTPDPMRPPEPTVPEQQPQTRIRDVPTRYGRWSTTLGGGHRPTREVTLAASVTYTMAGGLDAQALEDYPLTRGWVASIFGTHEHKLAARDALSSNVTLQQAWSSQDAGGASGNEVTTLLAGATWTHRYTPHTSSQLGPGISVSRTPAFEVYTAWSVYPTFTAAVTHERKLARGLLTLTLNAFSTPELDPLRATVDPRIGGRAAAGWTRDRFSTSLTGSATISIAAADNNPGAFDQRQAALVAGYRLTDWLLVDAGGRLAEQQYQDTTTIPLTYVAFVGLTLGHVVPLVGAPE